MAEAVVDHLEAVQVEEAQADLAAGAVRVQRGGQPVQEHRPVRQPGERVVVRLVAEPVLEPVAFGDVLDDRNLVARGAVVAADQRHGQVRPDRRPVGPVELLLGAERLTVALHQVPVVLPDLGRVVRVQEVRDVAAAEVRRWVAEHLHQRRVDVQDVAGRVADADAHRGIGEQCPEPGVAGPERRLGLVPGGQRRLPDLLLLGQRQGEQRLGVPAGHGALQVGHPRPEPAVGGPAEAGQQQVAEQRGGLAQRLRPGEVRVDQRLADPLAGGGGERLVEHGGSQQVGKVEGEDLDLGRDERAVAGAVQHPGPGPGELHPAPLGRARRPRCPRPSGPGVRVGVGHGFRPTPANPENRSGRSSASVPGSGRHSGRYTRPGSTNSYPSKNAAIWALVRMVIGVAVRR